MMRSWCQQDEREIFCGILIDKHCPPTRHGFVSAARSVFVQVWDLESKSVVEELKPESLPQEYGKKAQEPYCVSLAWSGDGSTLYAGYTNGIIYAYVVALAN